ncbi:MAG: YgjP-like metallopeptidase domain-containing protein [Sphaerochaetaceae bacterium]
MKILGKVQSFSYTITYRRNARMITLHCNVHDQICVSAPYFTSKREIEQVVLRYAVRLKEKQAKARSWEAGVCLYIAGDKVSLQFSEVKDVTYKDGNLYLPREKCIDEYHVYKMVREFYRGLTMERVTPLIKSWCRRLNLVVYKVSIHDSHRVWASCSRVGNLNFSLRCGALDDEDLSYLVLHELDHRVNFNHGPAFHSYLDEHMPQWRQCEKHLKLMQPLCDISYCHNG